MTDQDYSKYGIAENKITLSISIVNSIIVFLLQMISQWTDQDYSKYGIAENTITLGINIFNQNMLISI